jgi:hypothetical protein
MCHFKPVADLFPDYYPIDTLTTSEVKTGLTEGHIVVNELN